MSFRAHSNVIVVAADLVVVAAAAAADSSSSVTKRVKIAACPRVPMVPHATLCLSLYLSRTVTQLYAKGCMPVLNQIDLDFFIHHRRIFKPNQLVKKKLRPKLNRTIYIPCTH